MKKILGTLILTLLLIPNINASTKTKIISDKNIIDIITKNLPQEKKIKEFLKRIAKNPEAISAITKTTKSNFTIIKYLDKTQVFTSLLIEKTKKLSKKGITDTNRAVRWAYEIIKKNKIKTGIILTSTGLIITGYLLNDDAVKGSYEEIASGVNNSTAYLGKKLSNYLDSILEIIKSKQLS